MTETRIFRILVADDDEAIRCSTAEALERRGFEIETAADGAEAVRIARRFRPDVGLFDLEMPNLDGLAAARRIHAAGLAMRVVIVSSAVGDDVRIAVRRSGARFMPKPLDLDALRAFLEDETAGGSLDEDGG